MDVAVFYNLMNVIVENEQARTDAEHALKSAYAELVPQCPHSEAIEFNHQIRGWGSHRCCKICGIVDRASEGGTPGDEYDYGYPGRPSRTFWEHTSVEVTKDEKVWNSYTRRHGWVVRDGKAYNEYGAGT